MPIYEYRCNQCGEPFEKMMGWSEADHNPTCPNCQSQDTIKKISAAASIGSSGSRSTNLSSSCGTNGGFR